MKILNTHESFLVVVGERQVISFYVKAAQGSTHKVRLLQEDSLNMGLLTYIYIKPMRYIDTSPYPKTPAPIPGYRLTGCNTKYTEGQLSFFRQLLMTKVTTAHWTCESIMGLLMHTSITTGPSLGEDYGRRHFLVPPFLLCLLT